jgi:hypothetical protein
MPRTGQSNRTGLGTAAEPVRPAPAGAVPSGDLRAPRVLATRPARRGDNRSGRRNGRSGTRLDFTDMIQSLYRQSLIAGVPQVVTWMFAQRLAAQRGADRPRIERGRSPVPVGGRPGPEPAPAGHGVDAGRCHLHPGQPAVHRPAGVEPAADRHRVGRPGRHRPGAPAQVLAGRRLRRGQAGQHAHVDVAPRARFHSMATSHTASTGLWNRDITGTGMESLVTRLRPPPPLPAPNAGGNPAHLLAPPQ